MNIRPNNSRNGENAFTMIEIAIALGVIAFALVAIIGVLPVGMGTERENHERTLIYADGPYLMEALRNGAQRFDDLTQYVDSITITTVSNGSASVSVLYTNDGTAGPNPNGLMTNGNTIVGLLTRPKYERDSTNGLTITNRIELRTRSISGGAVFSTNKDLAFHYSVICEVEPHLLFDTNRDVLSAGDPAFEQHLGNNLWDVRLTFRWPLLPDGSVGDQRKVFRTMVPGQLIATTNVNTIKVWSFQPQNFAQAQ